MTLDVGSAGGSPIEIGGEDLSCSHCRCRRFRVTEVRISVPVRSTAAVEWFEKAAQAYVCWECGRMEWFLNPALPPEEDTLEPTECLSCGKTIPGGETVCPVCGWTYRE